MRKVPLLDLGNVVVKVDFTPFLEWLSQRAGHGEVAKVLPLLRSSLFYDFEFGHVSPREFARRLQGLYGASFAEDELFQKFCDIFPGLVDGVEGSLQEMANAGPVYCLTNTNEIHLEHIRARFPVLAGFTHVFASHEMGRRKPYPGIYRDVARELDLEPSRIIFFDDLAANVEGARRAGLEAHVFTGVADFSPWMKSGLNLVDKENKGI